MKLYLDRTQHLMNLSALVASGAALAEIHEDSPIPDNVLNWLGRLTLLYGMPFNYLVPDEKMLPNESIRFFQVDSEWIDSLIEGGLSIGRSTSVDLAHDAIFQKRLHSGAAAAARNIRTSQPRDDGNDNTPLRMTGFFLRSAALSGWPGLEIMAYGVGGNILPVLRMDRISPAILLVLVDGAIDHIDIQEPLEGVHFGLDISGGKKLRYITVPKNAPAEAKPGSVIEGLVTGPVSMRDANVVKVNQLAEGIGQRLAAGNANNDPATGTALPFTSAEFALEMIAGAHTVRFINNKNK